jgi:DNA modification methylase
MIEVGFYPDRGYVLCGLAENASEWLRDMHCHPALVVADPPYGGILHETWDLADTSGWITVLHSLERFRSPVYWWGGIGKPGNRPFFHFIVAAEEQTNFRMRDLITWKKVRAFGKKTDYLFTREECAIFTYQGDAYPTFNIPLLDQKRGYAGFNAKYPAKSEYLRRSNVWAETELLRGKLHPAHKAPIVCRIPIEVHTKPKDLVLDLYAGSGETSIQALRLGRSFVAVEKDRETAVKICVRIEAELSSAACS